MNRTGTASLLVALLSLAPLAIPACGASAPPVARPVAASASASASVAAPVRVEPGEGPVATLPTGELAPLEHSERLQARFLGRLVDDRLETMALELVLPLDGAFDRFHQTNTVVSLDEHADWPYAFVAMPHDVASVTAHGLGTVTLWVRRPRSEVGHDFSGVVFVGHRDNEPGRVVRFSFVPAKGGDAKSPSGERKWLDRWGLALAEHLEARGATPFHKFAAARLYEIFAKPEGPTSFQLLPGGGRRPLRAGPPPIAASNPNEFSTWMETTTGLTSIQETLQGDRPLLLALGKQKRTIAIEKLGAPQSPGHSFDAMLKALGTADPAEPIARAVPAEFWYLRASTLGALFRLTDHLDAWATPAANLFDGRLEERDLAKRYETQLGIVETELGRALGDRVVASVALSGSDPYFREGSDLTLIFQVKSALAAHAALDEILQACAQTHGGVTKSTVSHRGKDITVSMSPDGAVRQHRFAEGDLEVVSNSLEAAKQVLDAIKGARPTLASENDFRYMLARDAEISSEVFGYLGEKFVREAIGPRQKVLEARRQIAAAELMKPGFAALLYGWMYGKAPDTVDDLIGTKLLRRDELAHASGGAIEWSPSAGTHSSWGTPTALTPLLDLPAPKTVSESERIGYARFAGNYQRRWADYVDPAALRLSFRTEKPEGNDANVPASEALHADLRVLPLIEGTEYNDIREFAGEARVVVPAPVRASQGARVAVGIGPEAELREELRATLKTGFGRRAFGIDFLGDWAMVGIADRKRVASVAAKFPSEVAPTGAPVVHDEESQKESVDEMAELFRVPAYAALAIKSRTGAMLALGALREKAGEAIGGRFTWLEIGKERDVSIVEICLSKEDAKTSRQSIYYALLDNEFLVALDPWVLRSLIDDGLDGRTPSLASTPALASTPTRQTKGAQLVFDLKGDKDGGLLTVLGWLMAKGLEPLGQASRSQAEAIFRGAPGRLENPESLRRLALSYLGFVPVPAYGGTFALGPDGVRDPHQGSAVAPRWPELPVAGSMIDKLLGAVGSFRSEVSLDTEGKDPKSGLPMRSLHISATVGLRK